MKNLLFNGLYLPEKKYTLLACAAHLYAEHGDCKTAEVLLALANKTHDESGCHEGMKCNPIGLDEAGRLYRMHFKEEF